MKRRNAKIFLRLFLCLLLLNSCRDERFVSLEEQVSKEYRIAVVLPLNVSGENPGKEPVEWALSKLNTALINQRHIRIQTEWYDENSYQMEELFSMLAKREDISAIIGPLYSRNAGIAAAECAATGKILIPATASSELLMRTFAGKGFLWCLTENDISQCELLLTLALQKKAKSVALLTCNDIYGQTFLDWFAFQARELNLTVRGIEVYDNGLNLQEKMESLLREDVDCIICVPSNEQVTLQMNTIRRAHPSSRPVFLFSDVAFLAKPDSHAEGMEGIGQAADPGSGFEIAYKTKYGKAPEYGSAQFYDAALLAGLGILEADLAGENQINSALKRIVSGTGEKMTGCSEEGVASLVYALMNREYPQIAGASGMLRFDKYVYTNVLHSVYCNWIVYQNKHLILEYSMSDESKRSSASSANWNWKVNQLQHFEDISSKEYPDKKGLYAVVIAGSSGWENYRHQADALAFYQQLKEQGLTDDHILLIMEDDIAGHIKNPQPGEIRIIPDGKNVYEPGITDYWLSSLPFSKLADILSGRGEGNTISPGAYDNVLVFWVGHGEPEGLKWLENTIPAEQIAGVFKTLSHEQRFRKLLFIIEACYAGRVGEYCAGIPGLLCITSALPDETSKVSNYSYPLKTWLSNSFTDALLEYTASASAMNFVDLYHHTYNRTLGSHVTIYNAEQFGSLYQTKIEEFLRP